MKDIKNILLFANGIWNGKTSNLDRIKRIFQNWQTLSELKLLPSAKLTHESTKPLRDKKYPVLKDYCPFAFGDLDNLRLEDTGKIHPKLKEPIYKIIGDLTNVPDNIANDWEQKKLKSASLEIKPSITLQDGTILKDVIDSVALLGNEIPALWQAESYMLDTELTEKTLISQSEFIQDCLPSEIYQLSDIENYENYKNEENETTMKMNKETYAAKMQKYALKGVKTKSHEDYSTMDNDAEESYFAKLESDLKALKESDDKEDYSLGSKTKELEALIGEVRAERDALKRDREKFGTDLKETYQLELNDMRKQREEIEKDRKLEKVKKEVYALSKSDNSKLPIALEELAITALMRADETTSLEKYSLGSTTKDKSDYQVISELFSNLPERPNMSHKEKYKNKEGVQVTDSVIEANPDVDAQQLIDDAVIEKYALDNKVSYEQSFDIFYGTKSMSMPK